MFQFAFESALFRFKQDGPTCNPLLQLPPAIAWKQPGLASCVEAPVIFLPISYHFPYAIFKKILLAGRCAPASPACGYAATGFLKERDGPMPQDASESALFRAKQDGPTSNPSSQAPPASANRVSLLFHHMPSGQ